MTLSNLHRIADRVESLCSGTDEWRVADPATGTYCIAFTRGWHSLNPEGDAHEWLRDHKERFPASQFAGYEVRCVRVRTELQTAALELVEAVRAAGLADGAAS